ncbi:hypothetical protein AAHE18_18G026900 [Arachis hypogaea]
MHVSFFFFFFFVFFLFYDVKTNGESERRIIRALHRENARYSCRFLGSRQLDETGRGKNGENTRNSKIEELVSKIAN